MTRALLFILSLAVSPALPFSCSNALGAEPNAPSQVVLDCSHEFPQATGFIEKIFVNLGFNAVRNCAALTSISDELARTNVLIIWQEVTDVPYTPAECALIRDFVSKGGNLVLMGNAKTWSTRNARAPASEYPLFKLASSMGVTLADADRREAVGKGFVVYFQNPEVCDRDKIVAEASTPGKISQTFLSVVPAPAKTAPSPTLRVIPPDGLAVYGPLRIAYPSNLAPRVEPLQNLVKRVLPALREVFGSPVEARLDLNGYPYTAPSRVYSHSGNLNLAGAPYDIAFEVTCDLAYCCWLPGGRDVTLPRWVSLGWTELAACRVLAPLGYQRETAVTLRVYHDVFESADPKMTALNLALDPLPNQDAACGKGIYILETLEKETGKNVIARFRKAVRIAHGDGAYEDTIDTDGVVNLLSLALGRDVSPAFRALGTPIAPATLDFQRFRKLELEIDKLLGTK